MGGGSACISGETCGCRVPMGGACECLSVGSEHQAGPEGESGTRGQESVTCAPVSVTSCVCQPQRRRGRGSLCLPLKSVLYVGAVEGSALSV